MINTEHGARCATRSLTLAMAETAAAPAAAEDDQARPVALRLLDDRLRRRALRLDVVEVASEQGAGVGQLGVQLGPALLVVVRFGVQHGELGAQAGGEVGAGGERRAVGGAGPGGHHDPGARAAGHAPPARGSCSDGRAGSPPCRARSRSHARGRCAPTTTRSCIAVRLSSASESRGAWTSWCSA